MPISIDWGARVIHVPQSYLQLVSGTLYDLDTEQFRNDLKDLEDDDVGMSFPDTHRHNTTVTVAGTTYARFIEIINGYSVEFEDGAYSIRLQGSNNNIFDIDGGVLVQNQVQVIPGNSAGLIQFGLEGISTLRDAVESLRSSHRSNSEAQTIYWDPYDGSDGQSGLTAVLAVKTFAKAHDLANSGANDVIFALANDPSGSTIVTEPIYITKNNIRLRGPGAHFVCMPTSMTPNNAAIEISGINCYLGGFIVDGTVISGLSADHGIDISGNNTKVENVVATNCPGGLHVTATNVYLERGAVIGNVGEGVHLDGATGVYVSEMEISANGSDGVLFDGSLGCTVSNTLFKGNSRSVHFTATAVSNAALGNCTFFDADVFLDEAPSLAGNAVVNVTPGAVWDVSVADHTTASTTGAVLHMLGVLGRNKTVTDPVAGTITVYEDDGITVAWSAPIWEDADATQQYRGQGVDRRDALS